MRKREAVAFPDALAAIRELRGLSQYALARRSEVPEGTISPIESGRRNPSRENLTKLANALGVDVTAIGVFLPKDGESTLRDLPGLVEFTRTELAAA